MRRAQLAVLAGLTLVTAAPACAERTAGEHVVAIDVLVEPDSIMTSRAAALNARLRENYPAGFPLDERHAPHITLVQRYVRATDIDTIAAVVSQIIAAEAALPLHLTASSYGGVVWDGVGLVDYVFDRSPALERLAARVVDAIAPFAVRGGTGAAFVPDPGEPINRATIAYVETFVPDASGPNFRPHVTVGNAQPGFLRRLQAEPFSRFDFAGVNVAIYQLGNFGTAHTRLWSSSSAGAGVR